MRIAAVLSGDEKLKYAFTDLGGDVHSLTAIAIFSPDMDVLEFMELKEKQPYKGQRAIAKNTNFRFLFGGSAWSFAEEILKKEWTKEFCLNFLDEAGLSLDSLDPFMTAAEFLRSAFFTSYPKLAIWHEKCHKIAKQNGMIRSIYGARRLLPRLLYIGKDTEKKVVIEDQNISKNTTVQNFESVVIMRGMREFHKFVKENGYKSKIFGMIHDAVEFYIEKEEKEFIVPKILEIFQRLFDEYDGVIMVFELEISDTSEGEVWGFGRKVA